MVNPLESAMMSFTNMGATMMAQAQAFLQNMATTLAQGVEGASSTMQRGQAAMMGGMESMMANLSQTAIKPLMALPQMAQSVGQGGQIPPGTVAPTGVGPELGGPGGQWTAEDQGLPQLRSVEEYHPLTEDRRQYYDFRAGGAGFTESPLPEEYERGSPRKTMFF